MHKPTTNAQSIKAAFGSSNLGPFAVVNSDQGIRALTLGNNQDHILGILQKSFPKANIVIDNNTDQALLKSIANFINNPTQPFNHPIVTEGTNFQEKIWKILRTIPVGTTMSYTDIANKIGSAKAVRAAASACAANKLAIVIPCHRVLRSDGRVSGYRFGVERKIALLQHEAELTGYKINLKI